MLTARLLRVGTVPGRLARRWWLTGVLGALAAAVALCAPAAPALAAGPVWLAPVGLSSAGSNAQRPLVGMDSSGDATELWVGNDSGTATIEQAHRTAGPGNAFSGAQNVSDGTSAASAPQLAVDANGDAIAVWVENAAGVAQVWAAYQPSGQGFGTAALIGTETGAQTAPAVALDPSGNAVATWVYDDSHNQVIQAAYAPAGSPFGAIQTLSADGQDAAAPRIAEDGGGDAMIVWQRSNGTYQQIWSAYRPSGGSFSAVGVVAGEAGNQATPTVAMDSSGDATAVWQYDDGTSKVIQYADAPASPAPIFGAPGTLTLDADGTASAPQLAGDAAGDTAVIWNIDKGATHEIQADGRPSGGSFPAAGAQATLGPADTAQQPQIALTSTGATVAAWDTAADVIDAALAPSPAGSAFGSATSLSDPAQPAIAPALAVDGQGNAIAGWLRFDGADEIAQAAGFDGGAGPTNSAQLIPSSTAAPVSALAGRGLTLYAYPVDVWPAISSVSWDFGDGHTGSGVNVTHTFATAGAYTVTVIATNADGNSTTTSQSISIAASAPAAPDGALEQLPAPSDCVTSAIYGCGTLDPFGTNLAYQPLVSPDGRNVYLVGFLGGIVEFSRDASTGALTQIGCVTSNSAGAPSCANDTFLSNALGNPAALAISSDGRQVYAVTQGSQSIVTFDRDPASGLLSEVTSDCYTSATSGAPPASCTFSPGLEGAYGVAVSPDGANVYVSAYAGASSGDVAEFTRDPSTGLLAPISGNSCISDGSFSPCPVQSAKGVAEAIGISISPDGKNVYAVAGGTSGHGDVAELQRNPSTGALSPIGGATSCIGAPGAPAGCASTAGAINGPEDMAISPDGRFAYVNSNSDDAIVELTRDATTGVLSPVGCVEGSSGPGGLGCGAATGINGAIGVALSPNGANLYASGAADNAEAAFSVNRSTGALAQLAAPFDCVTSNAPGLPGCGQSDATGLFGARRVTVSPDGRSVYVAGQGSQTVVAFSRTDVARHVTVSATPTTIIGDGKAVSTVTAAVTDAAGNGVTGEHVAFSADDPGVVIGVVSADADGTYSATVMGSTSLHAVKITATDSSATPGISGSATLTQTAGPASSVGLAVAPASLFADGISNATVIATVSDAEGHPIAGDHVSFSASDPGHVRLGQRPRRRDVLRDAHELDDAGRGDDHGGRQFGQPARVRSGDVDADSRPGAPSRRLAVVVWLQRAGECRFGDGDRARRELCSQSDGQRRRSGGGGATGRRPDQGRRERAAGGLRRAARLLPGDNACVRDRVRRRRPRQRHAAL